ncbi:MAG: hypothetical protein HOO67_05685 [Candidatus Peribacteraceae bacterium]|nr:hypothetical protein [Candidatus Peribacteraceae bacterium]
MILPTSPLPAEAGAEKLMRSVGSRLTPAAGAEARVRLRVRQHLRGPALLQEVRDALTPDDTVLARLWSAIRQSIHPVSLSFWNRLRETLLPPETVQSLVWDRLVVRLEPSYARAAVSKPVKWVAAFALVIVVVRMSPLLFLAPTSIAESPVLVFSTRGNAEILLGSLWQPIRGEITLKTATKLQTQEGEATIVAHDDAVFRLAPHTRVSFLDLSDRPEVSKQQTTLVLEEGTLWVLGLVPKHLRGITVVTAQGRIIVHEGSVSVSQGPDAGMSVFDRSATVWRHGKQVNLVAGDRADLGADGDLATAKMDPLRFQDAWVAGNLGRDAAHQHEIAQLQQERRAASAGILPGATLYGVKRLAERVDVLLSFSSDERARKLVTQANTRLNEAAATSGTQRSSALQEYKDTLLQVASGSGGSSVVRSLLQREVVEGAPATVSAALPGDESYALKQAVDETIAALPVDTVESKPDLESAALLDVLAVLRRQAEDGDTAMARQNLSELADSLSSLDTTGSLALVPADARQEAKAMAEQVVAFIDGPAQSHIQGPAQGIQLSLGAPAKPFIQPQHRTIVMRPMTPAQVAAKAQEIRGRIFVFGTKKARYDALQDQMSLLLRHPDRGSILRELSKVMPRDGLAQRVVREIQAVSIEVEAEVTASGGTAGPY